MSPFVILLTGDSNKRGEQRDRQSLCRISRVRWGERRHWHSTARGDVVAAARMNTRPKVPPNRRINPPTFKDRLQMSWDAAAFSSPKSSARPVSRYRGNGNGRNPLSLALRPEEFLSAPIGSRASWAQQRGRLARPSFCPISVVSRAVVSSAANEGCKRETYEITRGTATLACHETPRPGESYWSGGIFSLFPPVPSCSLLFAPVQIDSLTLYCS